MVENKEFKEVEVVFLFSFLLPYFLFVFKYFVLLEKHAITQFKKDR